MLDLNYINDPITKLIQDHNDQINAMSKIINNIIAQTSKLLHDMTTNKHTCIQQQKIV